jgi:hypothetical protein
MAQFMAVYTAPRKEIDAFMAKPESQRREEVKEDAQKWNEWQNAHEDELADEGGMFGKTKRITEDGVSDTRNELTGYSIVEAENYDEAVKTFQQHPYLNFPGAAIEVMERLDMQEMLPEE